MKVVVKFVIGINKVGIGKGVLGDMKLFNIMLFGLFYYL